MYVYIPVSLYGYMSTWVSAIYTLFWNISQSTLPSVTAAEAQNIWVEPWTHCHRSDNWSFISRPFKPQRLLERCIQYSREMFPCMHVHCWSAAVVMPLRKMYTLKTSLCIYIRSVVERRSWWGSSMPHLNAYYAFHIRPLFVIMSDVSCCATSISSSQKFCLKIWKEYSCEYKCNHINIQFTRIISIYYES